MFIRFFVIILLPSRAHSTSRLTRIFTYKSPYRMSGYVASTMQNNLDKTIIALDESTGGGSCRGDLTIYIKDKLKDLDYLVLDGHPGFMGLNISVSPETFVNDIIRILK